MVLVRAATNGLGVSSALVNNAATLITSSSRASGSKSHQECRRPTARSLSSDAIRTARTNPFFSSRRSFTSSARSNASIKDPYATLGVKRDASSKDIKTAYYGLAKKYHPDTSKEKGAKERFVEIQSAYDILSDDKKKAAFDQYGSTDGSPGFDPFGGGGGGSPFGGFGGFEGFQGFGGGGQGAGNASDIFEGLFGAFGGGRGRTSGPGFAGEARGEDLETTIQLTFEEACRGTNKSVTISPVERCNTCEGKGLKKGAKRRTCGVCNGTGTRTFVIQSGFQMASTCPACNGAGQIVGPGDECGTCEGVGRVRSRKTVEVKVPPGVDDGAKIRMDGQGDVPLQGSGTAGALYVRIGVRPSKIWRRQGNNLYYPATVPFHTAILGGRVRVPTLDGNVDVRVPAGTQVGDEMLLRGRGVSNVLRRGDKGDLLVQFQVTIPRSLSQRQKDLLQRYVDDVEGRQPAPPPPPPKPTPPPAQPTTPSPPPHQASPAPQAEASTSPNEASSQTQSSKPVETDSDPVGATSEGEYKKDDEKKGGFFNSMKKWLGGKGEK
jgi:molecular chaperone DnaJ